MQERIDSLQNPWTDRDVEEHWDRIADIYVKENTRVKKAHDQRFRESIGFLEIMPGMKILNISSRDAGADDYIKADQPHSEVIHAEISGGLMKVAESLRPYIQQIKLTSYSSLPFEDHYFDRILSLETLEHAEDPLAYLKELYRVSKDNARMVLSCPPATSEIPYRFYTFFFGGHGEGPHRFPSSRKVKELLKMTGWKLLIHRGTLLIPAGPVIVQDFGEKVINKFQGTCIAELGIRQFYICEKTG